MAVHVYPEPKEKQDIFSKMRRPDLYQWADENNVDYPRDAPASAMRDLLRSTGKVPPFERFSRNEDGSVKEFLRKPRSEAPISRHEIRVRKKAAQDRDKQWERYMAMPYNDLKRMTKDQFGAKSVDEDPSKEWMITRLVGPRIKSEIDGVEVAESDSYLGIPLEILEMQSPLQLVSICKKNGIDAKKGETKDELLEKIKRNG